MILRETLFTGLGIGLIVLALMLPPERFQVLIGSVVVGILGLIVKSWLLRKILQRLSGEEPIRQCPMLGSKVIKDKELEQRVKTIIERLGAEVQEAEVDVSFPFPYAMLVGKTLLVSKTFLDTFSPEEQEFLIARAIVDEQMDADRLNRLEAFGTRVGILSLCTLTGITVVLLRLIGKPITHLQFLVACCGVGLMTLSLVGLFFSSSAFLRRRFSEGCETIDRIALSATRNLPAAESAMRELAQWKVEDLKRNHFATSPQEALQMEQSIKRELREDLDRLQHIAGELGLREQG